MVACREIKLKCLGVVEKRDEQPRKSQVWTLKKWIDQRVET
jgi:hypothetical protein